MAKRLIHYTNVLSSIKILYSGIIRFGNVIYSNDATEITNLEEDDDGYFVFCTNKEKFNALMWLAYSKDKNGCAIRFNFKGNKEFLDLFEGNKYKIDFFDVRYKDNYFEEIGNDISKLCKFKDSLFKGENEWRYLIKLEKSYDREATFLPININFDALESIDVIIDKENQIVFDMFKGIFEKKYKIQLKIVVQQTLNNK